MKIPPKGSSFEYQESGRSEYAQLVINRLGNEIGYYIELIDNNPHPLKLVLDFGLASE